VKLTQDKGKLEVTFGECLLDVGDDPARAEKQEPKKDATAATTAASASASAAAPPSTLAERIPEGAAQDGDASVAGDSDAKDGGGRRSNKKNSDRRDSQTPPT
jgi:hypothetical protein